MALDAAIKELHSAIKAQSSSRVRAAHGRIAELEEELENINESVLNLPPVDPAAPVQYKLSPIEQAIANRNAERFKATPENKELRAAQIEIPLKEGDVEKKSPSFFASWQPRHLILYADRIEYKENDTLRGTIKIKDVSIVQKQMDGHFNVKIPNRTFEFQTPDAADAADWVEKINKAVIAMGVVGGRRKTRRNHKQRKTRQRKQRQRKTRNHKQRQ